MAKKIPLSGCVQLKVTEKPEVIYNQENQVTINLFYLQTFSSFHLTLLSAFQSLFFSLCLSLSHTQTHTHCINSHHTYCSFVTSRLFNLIRNLNYIIFYVLKRERVSNSRGIEVKEQSSDDKKPQNQSQMHSTLFWDRLALRFQNVGLENLFYQFCFI